MTVIYCHHAVSRGTLDPGRVVRQGSAGAGARPAGAGWTSARGAGSPDAALLHDARFARPSRGDARPNRLLWHKASLAAPCDQAHAGSRFIVGSDSAGDSWV